MRAVTTYINTPVIAQIGVHCAGTVRHLVGPLLTQHSSVNSADANAVPLPELSVVPGLYEDKKLPC